ncbi:Squalene--hopene cyclase [Minicystis rosea]|nr:Squalene--hopene cyclase [Minicystis rosea]
MAANASNEVGLYLRGLMPDGSPLARVLPTSVAEAQIELIREANNAVFEDIAWAHGAFLDPDGGLGTVEDALAALPTHRLLLDGFRAIAEGRIWEGTAKLLEHEQRHTVQPRFAAYHPAFAAFLSLAARSDFRLGDARVEQRHFPAFTAYMLRRARPFLRDTGALRPDIARIDHRWYWIEREVLPCWREVEEAAQPPLRERMMELSARWPGPPEHVARRSAAPLKSSALDEAIARAAAHLRAEQRADGSWDEPCDAGPTTTAHALVALHALGRIDGDLRARTLRYLAGTQREDGAFEAYPDAGEPDVGATASVIAALACLAERDMRARAEAWLDTHGGHDAVVRTSGKGDPAPLFLAFAGVLPAERLPHLPSAWLLSAALRRLLQRHVHPGVRMMAGQQAVIRRFLVAGRAPVRTGIAGRIDETIIALQEEMQNPSGGLFEVVTPSATAVLGFIAAGLPFSDDRLRRLGDFLLTQVEPGPEGSAWIPGFRSSLWSTALSLRALLRAGASVAEPSLERAVSWLAACEHAQPAAWSAGREPLLMRDGGYAFQRANVRMPDCDDTAVALDALAAALEDPELEPALRKRVSLRAGRALAWLLGMQNPDGGFAAFLRGLPSKPRGPILTEPLDLWPNGLDAIRRLRRLPLWALGDPSTEDVTGRTLRALARLGLMADHPRSAKAISFLEGQQMENGAFWGRWSTNYLWATAHVILGARAAGVSAHAPWLRRAAAFLRAHQNEDGGFGETERSYRDPALAGVGPSMPAVTALCLEAFVAMGDAGSAAAARAARYLIESQKPEGDWPDAGHLQVFIPPSQFYRYPGAHRFQPLEALAALREAMTS